MLHRSFTRRESRSLRDRTDRRALAVVIGTSLGVVLWAQTLRTARVGMPGSMPPPRHVTAPQAESGPDEPRERPEGLRLTRLDRSLLP